MKILVKKRIPPFEVGEHEVEDNDGVPADAFWRRRLEDAKTDECCEIISGSPPKEKKKKKASAAPASDGEGSKK